MNMNSMYNKISKEDFLRLNEEDLVFITNPGRMGDENGSTFIIRHDNEFTIYRVEGWLYPPPGTIVEIKPDDVEKQINFLNSSKIILFTNYYYIFVIYLILKIVLALNYYSV